MRKLNSFVLSENVINSMKNKLEVTRKKKVETGFSLCRKIDTNILELGNDCEGTDCRIMRPFQRCTGTDMYEGLYHTHPDEPARPSIADSYGMYLDGIGCIGSATDNNINCFIRKDKELDIKTLDYIEFELYYTKFNFEKFSQKEYEDKLQNIANKHFKKVEIIDLKKLKLIDLKNHE